MCICYWPFLALIRRLKSIPVIKRKENGIKSYDYDIKTREEKYGKVENIAYEIPLGNAIGKYPQLDEEMECYLETGEFLEPIKQDAISQAVYYLISLCVELHQDPVMVGTGQFEDETRPRSIADLINEMSQELLNLLPYTAYLKVGQEKDGQQSMAKHKIRTYKLPEASEPAVTEALQEGIRQRTREHYGKKRTEIEEEIRERQAPWRTEGIGLELPQKTKRQSPKDMQPAQPETEDQGD